jgi:formylmethanofuran dehydrogenase subunit B
MENPAQTNLFRNVTCPFCGLLCDDLTIERNPDGQLSVIEHGCHRSVTFFGRKPVSPSPRIRGQAATLHEAITATAEILRNARLPLIAGLGTDVQGMRAVMSLADKVGATLDHMNSNGFMRNLHVMQNSGWQTCTLTEVRNRVDLLVILATDVVSLFPRFFERQVWNTDSMFEQDTSKREVVYLGGRDIDTMPGIAPDGRKPDVLPCDLDRLPEVVAALRALVEGKKLQATDVAGIPTADLDRLAERLKAAKYSVVAWAAGKLDFAHAELTVQNVAELVKTLNKTTRSSGLPLGGNEGEMNANQVSAWISGYPMRTSYARGYPEHDPYHLSADQLVASGEADVLLWVSTFNPDRTPPRSGLPTIVLGHAAMQLEDEPDVYIPVGMPGADHKGVMFRSDNVVSLPLEQLRASRLPTLGEVLGAIEQAL